MLRDLGSFLKDLFGQWWARIGVINGLIGSTGRLTKLDPSIEAGISWGFRLTAIAALCWGVFCVYRKQAAEIERLKRAALHDNTMIHVVIEKLSLEILHNLENLNKNAVMLRDEAFSAIGPNHLALLPAKTRSNLIRLYNCLRAFKELSLTDDNRQATAERKQDLRRQIGQVGQTVYSQLIQDRQSWAR